MERDCTSFANEFPVLEIICCLIQDFLKTLYSLLMILLLSSRKSSILRQLGLVEARIT